MIRSAVRDHAVRVIDTGGVVDRATDDLVEVLFEHRPKPAYGEFTPAVRVNGEAQFVGEQVLRQARLRVAAVDGQRTKNLMSSRMQEPEQCANAEIGITGQNYLAGVPPRELTVRRIEVGGGPPASRSSAPDAAPLAISHLSTLARSSPNTKASVSVGLA